MKACYKKIKTAIRPAPVMGMSSEIKSQRKHSVPTLQTLTQLRHAKCLQPRQTCHPSAIRRRRVLSPEPMSVEPGSLALAQIRAVPLNVRNIRGTRESRSSYIINAQQIREGVVPLLKRSRSLSPRILRTTGTSELKSPHLVRSVSNCGTRATSSNPTTTSTIRRKRLLCPDLVERIPRQITKSQIPVRSPPSPRKAHHLLGSIAVTKKLYPLRTGMSLRKGTESSFF